MTSPHFPILFFGDSQMNTDQAMLLALEEARLAMANGDVPVGAVVIAEGNVIARRHNEREADNNPIGHAEVLAIQDAARELGEWRLNNTTLVVTLEPCVMCAGALVGARIGKVIFGARDPKAGAVGSLYNICSDPRLNHEADIEFVDNAQCQQLLKDFFAERRSSRADS